MMVLLFTVIQFAVIAFYIYEAQRSGYWSWSKFLLTIVFILFEGFLIGAPLIYVDLKSRWFWPICGVTWATVLVFGFFFVRSANHWQLGPRKTAQEKP
jgi:hypothetical protein